MLSPFSNSEQVVNILSIDPGSQTLGLAVLSFDPITLEMKRTQAQTFKGDRLPGMSDHVENSHGAMIARLQAHRTHLYGVMCHYRPHFIASESPFYSSRMPSAYGVLMNTLDLAIRSAMSEYSPYMKLNLIDPPSVKKAVGAKGNDGKDAVRVALLRICEKLCISPEDIKTLDEHSIDAIAVGYSFYCGLVQRNST